MVQEVERGLAKSTDNEGWEALQNHRVRGHDGKLLTLHRVLGRQCSIPSRVTDIRVARWQLPLAHSYCKGLCLHRAACTLGQDR